MLEVFCDDEMGNDLEGPRSMTECDILLDYILITSFANIVSLSVTLCLVQLFSSCCSCSCRGRRESSICTGINLLALATFLTS